MKLFSKQFITQPFMLIIFAAIGIGIGVATTLVSAEPTTKTTNCPAPCVVLKSDGMYPNELAVKVGETVQFNAADGQKHNIAEGDGQHNHTGHNDPSHHDHVGGFVSGEFQADEAWRVTFKKPGTYKLHDHYNPKQNILVVVYEESKR